MNGTKAIELLKSGHCLRIKCWPEYFFLRYYDGYFIFSDGKKLTDLSYFEVNDWEIYDPSIYYFSARCEIERLNRLSYK